MGRRDNDFSWELAAQQAALAVREYDDALRLLATSRPVSTTPVAAEAWIFNPDLSRVLLVKHRWREWVPPGGKVDPGEHPIQAACREVMEETGLLVELIERPAASGVRAFHADWSPTLALSHAAIAAEVPCVGETGQPAAWMPLRNCWATYFPADPARMQWHAEWLRRRDKRVTC